MSSIKKWKNHLCAALLLGAASLHGALAAPILSLVATPNPAVVSQTVELSLNLSGVNDLFAYQYSLSYNAAVLQLVSSSEGDLLASAGDTYFDPGIDDGAGTISYGFNTLLGFIPGANGSGTLVHYIFNVIAPGSSAFALSDLLFLNIAGDDLGVTVAGLADLNAVPEPSALLLFGIGLAGVGVLRRRQRSL